MHCTRQQNPGDDYLSSLTFVLSSLRFMIFITNEHIKEQHAISIRLASTLAKEKKQNKI